MGVYNSAVITATGQALLAQSVAGNELKFTTVKTSNYAYPAGTNLADLTTITGIKQSKNITNAVVYNSRVVKVSAMVDNAGVTAEYSINTIGIYATVGTAAEQLFAVVTASEADKMPAFSNRPYSYIYDLNLTMQSTANITVTVNNAGFVNINDLNTAINEVNASIDALDDEKVNVSDIVNDLTSSDTDKPLSAAMGKQLNSKYMDNAGGHNCIYRGKNLGASVTNAQWAAIAAGTFDDMYIGDYWVINGVNWRIAAFDYYLTTGDTACNTHHVTIVPDTNLDTQQMNSSNTTADGYTGSAMYTANMATAKNKIISAFGSPHLLTHREYLVNTVANGRPSAAAWVDSQIELMTEQNVYGGKVFTPTSDGSSVPTVHTIDKSQYPLFAHDPHMISNRCTYWLRDVVSVSSFANVTSVGLAYGNLASYSLGVRPAFSIK